MKLIVKFLFDEGPKGGRAGLRPAANIAGVAEAAAVTTEGVEQSRQAAAELAEMSTSLRGLVSRFTV
ncbi:hypothetical protein [Planomonospora parontospora]|uniref:hypothetical protein n=1 Tax=Planomonospora parontospora TaxID=58119 RepID=UPI0016718381|nr:hypothetical protein [Planomonospora parontospora]GGL58427.1 hypothetical protein GCM10014719_69750 [Planomonospora parontospora subsp. antibiotica]GII20153.1 hypothetical protein Ppa05_68790 [Planomonospora parontospora subsp. antibiotica]